MEPKKNPYIEPEKPRCTNSLAAPCYAFLVSDCVDYEGCHAIAVFAKEDLASYFVKRCVAYDQQKPQCPNGENVSSWDEHQKAYNHWVDNHPGGKTCGCVDEYIISKIQYYV